MEKSVLAASYIKIRRQVLNTQAAGNALSICELFADFFRSVYIVDGATNASEDLFSFSSYDITQISQISFEESHFFGDFSCSLCQEKNWTR